MFRETNKKKYLATLMAVSWLFSGFARAEPGDRTPSVGFSSRGLEKISVSFSRDQKRSYKGKRLQGNVLLDLNQMDNWDRISRIFRLSEGGKSFLLKNGFLMVDDTPRSGDMIKVYGILKREGIPIFVTSDSVLHLLHLQFVQALVEIEERHLIPRLREISRAMLEDARKAFETTKGALKEAARRNVAFFSVGLKLQDPEAFVPKSVEKDVIGEIQNIENHRGFSRSNIFKYREDFSQYVPRGYYARNEALKNYFKAMSWYGRMGFLLKGGLISRDDAEVQTLQACLIAASLPRVRIGERTAAEIWKSIYAVTGFFVGSADDLTPVDYRKAMEEAGIDTFRMALNENRDILLEVKAKLAGLDRPKIFGGTGDCVMRPPITKEKVERCLGEMQGMRLMGQRFIPDSYVFQNLVNLTYTANKSPFTMVRSHGASIRGFPRGLDLMALLGSNRAKQILRFEGDADYKGYDAAFNSLEKKFGRIETTKWTQNLYWNWLYSLKSLLMETPGKGHPLFMQTDAWREKQLHTALASWAQLRHDTILYAKPSYTPTAAMPVKEAGPPGSVEPLPELYARLRDFTLRMEKNLLAWGVLEDLVRKRLRFLGKILDRLVQISRNELKGEALSGRDLEFIRDFGELLEGATRGIGRKGKRTLTIADVHTDLNSGEVLEEGVGYVNPMLVVLRRPDGGMVLGAGPVFSYYEFKWPMTDRLTDEKWDEMLHLGKGPERPLWIQALMN